MGRLELLYHYAASGRVIVKGLDIRPNPECEGGGYTVPKRFGKALVEAEKASEALRLAANALSYCRNDGDEFERAYQTCLFALGEPS